MNANSLQVNCYQSKMDSWHGWCAVCRKESVRGEPGFCHQEGKEAPSYVVYDDE